MQNERFYLGADLTFAQSGEPRVSGYAVVFDRLSKDLGGFKTIIAPSAVDNTLTSKADVRAFWNHDPGSILGRVSAGTLALAKDTRGLHFSLALPNTTIGRDVFESLKRGDITGCSFGCKVKADSWDTKQPVPVRTITDADIFEVSLVSMPAFADTSVALASLSLYQQSQASESGELLILQLQHRLNLSKGI